ncbi:enoyl-CoA hydratase [Planococcus sp. CP5-4]|uniref:enoyl-CoA hydratase n=1 Tax=unclassified Planococcus (in: firmicutes) TaxID=2662419 RepID=UPI001C21641D|nr:MULTISPECIES: enoyl-CoA hydratase [unclassified Planococcus (in: firmicutes)]MBU9674135.1 enoyl-CoA hydratase [Planococcus sp. CP5-4_YE]MBV0910046.1 enoyl-CoA hydratase [Planococcus sp. CP5-4_UN]MBW6064580.1 enoyl-CoA hydratase [Planococcus sp. CP5-4]
MYQTIMLKKNGRLAYLVLNRPDSMNAMNAKMMGELADCFESLKNDHSVHALIIYGTGRAFSAGGDIKEMVNPDNPMDIDAVMEDVSRLARALYTLPQVTIAAVHGASAGLGFSMALACDHVVAEESSKLAMNFIGIGLIPDGGGHFFLKERVGVPRAKQLIWAGQVLKAHDALAKGLIEEVTAEGRGLEQAEKYAHEVLASPVAAMLKSKEILHGMKLAELDEVLAGEAAGQSAMRKTADHIEGIQAFVEKRKPAFKGK